MNLDQKLDRIDKFLSYLKSKKVKLWLEGDNLNYNGPKEVITPKLLSQLKQRRLEIIKFLQKHKAESSSDDIIYPREKQDWYPLSFSQQRLWFVSQLEPDSPLYHLSWAVKLKGNLNLEALQKTLNTIVRRHEALRTTFTSVEGEPVQVVSENYVVEMPIVDLTQLPFQKQDGEVERLLSQQSRHPFDLSSDLMLRATLLQLQEQEYVLLLVLHHIAADGWSLGLLFREIATLYRSFSTGKSLPLAELPIQYADFAIWQRQWLEGKVMAKQLGYWKQKLQDAPPILALPTDKPRPEIQTFKGAKYSFTIPAPLTNKLKEICQQEKVTLFMLLLAAFQILLCRYTGQEDIIVGSPIANRKKLEIERLIGVFVNTLILRTHLDGNPTFQELLQRVREVTLGAYTNQDLPIEKLIEKLQPERYKSTSPLVQVMFVLQNAPRETLELPDLTLTRLNLENPTAKFDLTLLMWENQSELQSCLEYNTDLFEAATMARMAAHLQTLLEAIATNPQQRILQLPLLSAKEQKQLILEWNDTETDYPRNFSLHELFETQVEQTPDAVAVVCEQQQITYQQLNCRANQLAHYLQELGVTTEVPVGIYVERSLDAIISIFGILKAGGAYVPLAPTYPEERLAFMVEDTQVQVILTQQRLLEKLTLPQAQLVCLDRDWEVISQHSQDNPKSKVTADSLAYIMYTSGSTGKPKGVNVLQRGVVRLVKGCDYADFNAEEIFLQLASISFDASTLEIWGPLLNGGKLVICPIEQPSLEELERIIQQGEITTLWLTVSLFNVIVDQRLEVLKGLRQLLIGGDVLSVTHVQKFQQQYPDCKLINGYGPTENTTFSCCYEIQDASELSTSIPIGKPIANTQVYILDRQRQLVPIGVAGEIYVGGDGVARGYLNRPDLTTEKFIDNPWENSKFKIQNSKLYKTGDLARYLPDGNIEFLGRIDKQVKISGFRIEPGEIEATINQYPAVRETIVLPRKDNLDNKQLVAYITYFQNQKPSVEELRLFLQEKLPDYMFPSAFVLLDGFPLTPNGKVDRSALPLPNQNRTESESSFVPPRTHLELQLTKIWEQVLGIQPIGIRDNFFQLGGHSLLALTLFEKIEQICKATIPMATLFSAPTIEQLTHIMRQKGWSSSWLSLVPLQANGSKPPLFYVHGVLGTVLSSRHLGNHLDKDQPLYGIQAQGLQQKQIVYHRVEDMAANYIQEIRTVQPEGPYCLVGVSTGGIIAFEMAQQLHSQNQQVAFLGLLDSQPPKLTTDPSEQDNNKNKNVSFREIFKNELPDDPEMIAFLEANYKIVLQYSAQVYPGKITFFLASESPRETAARAILNWCELAGGGLEIHKVPGDHLSIIHEENVPILGHKMQNCLNQVLEKRITQNSELRTQNW